MSQALLLFFQPLVEVAPDPGQPLLSLAEVFTFFFVTMGPPLKTPAAYFLRTHSLDAATRRSLAFKTFVLATVAVFIGGFLGVALRVSWHISIEALMLAGGIIFFLVSLRTVMDQYETTPVQPGPGATPQVVHVPTAFETAVPMIVTPYGLAAVIIVLAASHSPERTWGIVGVLLAVMVLHLLAMLFSGPMLRTIGPLPFKLFGTVIGAISVALSIQMIIAALFEMGLITSMGPLGS